MPLPTELAPLGSLRWPGPPRFDLSPDQWGIDAEATNGLTYGYIGGQALDATGATAVIADGTVLLADNTTNYVERTYAGVVSANQTGFTTTSIPMAEVVTLAGVIDSHANWRAHHGPFPYFPITATEAVLAVPPSDVRYGYTDVRRFGGNPAGVDNTAAIMATHDALPATGGEIHLAHGNWQHASEILITKPSVHFVGETPGNELIETALLYTGAVDNTKAMVRCSAAAHNFCLSNLFLDANDRAGFCLYQVGDPTPLLTRGGKIDSMALRGYRVKGWVIGDSTDVLNPAQFQTIIASNIHLLGGGNGTNADGIHVNAQNMEWLVITGLYIDCETTNNRYHRNHIRQIAGGVHANGMLSTRAGTSTLIADYAIRSSDQLIINGWRSEDRYLIDTTASTVKAASFISGVVQRDRSATAGTAGTDQVIRWNHIGGPVAFKSVTLNGSLAIGATDPRFVDASGVYFDNQNAAATVGDFVYSGPQNQSGLMHNVRLGQLRLRGTAPVLEVLDQTGVSGFLFDFLTSTLQVRGAAPVLNLKDLGGASHFLVQNGAPHVKRASPAAIAAQANDYNPGVGCFFRLSASGAAQTITGFSNTGDGRRLIIANVGALNLTLAHLSASSAAANEIICSTGANIVLAPNEMAGLIYDNSTFKWRAWKL